ncbi:hypothetical protein [Marinifilum fragile]|uniref:hypothetical protein n=1 Tax=Marinifilum fragile TaxID=570161 RepID=UPI002AAB8539|nr:hypothetical protein [Marinifilum fragile]
MSEQQNYDDSLVEIKAVKNENVKHCSMPVGMYIQEIKAMIHVAKEDLPLLTPVGYTEENLTKLEVLTGALSIAQAIWDTQLTAQKNAQKKWKKDAPAMFERIRDLYENMRFAYRKNDELQEILDEINEGDSNADAVMDLLRLGTLGNNNQEPLAGIGFDIAKCNTAISESERMGALLAEVNGSLYVDDERKLIRDKAYSLVKQYADDLKEYGQFVFRDEEEHAMLYSSKYLRNKKAEYRRKKKEEENTQEETVS